MKKSSDILRVIYMIALAIQVGGGAILLSFLTGQGITNCLLLSLAASYLWEMTQMRVKAFETQRDVVKFTGEVETLTENVKRACDNVLANLESAHVVPEAPKRIEPHLIN